MENSGFEALEKMPESFIETKSKIFHPYLFDDKIFSTGLGPRIFNAFIFKSNIFPTSFPLEPRIIEKIIFGRIPLRRIKFRKRIFVYGSPAQSIKVPVQIIGNPFLTKDLELPIRGNPAILLKHSLPMNGTPATKIQKSFRITGDSYKLISSALKILGSPSSTFKLALSCEGKKDFRRILWQILEEEE